MDVSDKQSCSSFRIDSDFWSVFSKWNKIEAAYVDPVMLAVIIFSLCQSFEKLLLDNS